MVDKPNLVLYWTFDIPNYKLFINIADDLEYEALEGGTLGYTKTYKGKVTHITPMFWEEEEKFWISENYGEIYGYFQPDTELVTIHPVNGYIQQCPNGLGREGEYLDHMQRSQFVVEAHDTAEIWGAKGFIDLFSTPDNGKTIYKRAPTRDVNYSADLMSDESSYWPEWPQACMMQPRSKGYRLSSHEEMLAVGCPESIVDQCRAGNWPSPQRPELQKYYIYPTK